MKKTKKKETPQDRYIKKHGKQIFFRLLDTTDADILEHLSKQPNRTGYIKKLIRDDIARSKD